MRARVGLIGVRMRGAVIFKDSRLERRLDMWEVRGSERGNFRFVVIATFKWNCCTYGLLEREALGQVIEYFSFLGIGCYPVPQSISLDDSPS